jgi:hypothetical protein
MGARKRLVAGIAVAAAVLAVLVTAHPAVPVSMLAASSMAGGSNGTSDGSSTGTWDGTTNSTWDGTTSDGCCTDSNWYSSSNSRYSTSNSWYSTSNSGPGGTSSGPGGTNTGPGGTNTGPGGTNTGPGGTNTGPGGTNTGPGGTTPGGPPSTGRHIPIALMSSAGGGVALLLLLLIWALLSPRAKLRRNVQWVKQHLRAVAQASPDPPSAEIRHRPGARSISLGLEPHDDHLGYQEN